MKKLLFFCMLFSATALTVAACSSNKETDATETPATAPQPGGRSLVVWFSCTGNTQAIAARIAEIADADTWQIRPATPYTAADLDYGTDCRANREQNDPSARPAIEGRIANLSDYEVVFLGYPIWWGKAPKVLSTFLESHDLAGKTVIPFCTSGSSGFGSSDAELRALAPQAVWKPGRRLRADQTKEHIASWIESIAAPGAAKSGTDMKDDAR